MSLQSEIQRPQQLPLSFQCFMAIASPTPNCLAYNFAPFHHGHQLLIETALAEMDELIMMVYDTDVIEVPLQVRAKWITTIYPSIRIIEAWDGPDSYGSDPEICREQEQYILKKLNGLVITHFYSSEFYGDHVSQALGAVDRRVDEARLAVPISGTVLRQDYFASRQYLDPIVYADLIIKACFMGAPSTGKTTLAQRLAEQHNTLWMPEYGAEYWLKHHKPHHDLCFCKGLPWQSGTVTHSLGDRGRKTL